MLDYCKTENPEKCCGCRACEAVCPTGAITMQKNSEGFLYPRIDTDKCIECGLCNKTCPVENAPEKEGVKQVYALRHNDKDILLKSSSGGAFRLLADKCIENGGVVVGCVFDENNNAVMKLADKKSDLFDMMGSKYVSSDMGDIFLKVKELLDKGITVLFTGAPCQCASILKYLRKPYSNLITADFLCHGMPSSEMLKAYSDSLGGVSDIRFRDKSGRGWGISFSYTDKKGKRRFNAGAVDPYVIGFTNGWFNRYICYGCPFRGENRFTDFTFFDYWGVSRFHNVSDTRQGVSAICINSEKGAAYFEDVKDLATLVESSVQNAGAENLTLLHTEKETIPAIRREIYGLVKNEGFNAVSKLIKISPIKRLKYKIPVSLIDKIKKAVRR